MEYNSTESGSEIINEIIYQYSRRSLDWLREHGDEIPFWLGDTVRVVKRFGTPIDNSAITQLEQRKPKKVLFVDYNFFGPKRKTPASNEGVYHVGPEFHRREYIRVQIGDLELVTRGPVWKFYHDQPLKFFDLRDEAEFYRIIGKFKSYSLPSGRYDWSQKQILEAIADNIMHGINGTNDRLWLSIEDERQIGHRYNYPQAIRFDNEELGLRIAQATLLGYGQRKQPIGSNTRHYQLFNS